MEEFGRNPDIDEPPVLSLEEYMQTYKPFFLPEDAELSQEQKWQVLQLRSPQKMECRKMCMCPQIVLKNVQEMICMNAFLFAS